MNIYLIAGAILLLAGTLLTTYGGIIQSRKDTAESAKKSEAQLVEISKDLADLKGKPKSELSDNAIQKVESDIAEWAKEFASKKQQRQLQVEQRISEHQSVVDHNNKLIQEYFIYFLSVIQKALAHYDADATYEINLELPDIPSRLFMDPDTRYEGRILFSPNVFWVISTFYNAQATDTAGPSFAVTLVKGMPDKNIVKEHGELLVGFSSDVQFFHIRLLGDFLLAMPMYTTPESTEEFEGNIKSILKTLIEFQLAQQARVVR